MHEPVFSDAPKRGRYRLQPLVDDVTRRRAGEANPRGRLERPTRIFRLRPGMPEIGAIEFLDALELVREDWDRQVAAGTIDGENLKTYTAELRTLAGLMRTRALSHVSDVDCDFILYWATSPNFITGAPASENTAFHRRSAARSFFETAHCLGVTNINPAKSVDLPNRSGRYVHAFTTDQMRQLKLNARVRLEDLRPACALGLVMSGATTQESGFITVDDIDETNEMFWSHSGGYRWRPRWLPFTDNWCRDAVMSRVNELRELHGANAGTKWLIFEPLTPEFSHQAQAMTGNRVITKLLVTARVHRKGVNRAESIREWLAAEVFAETGSLGEVAARLGMSSLDAAAHIVGYDWVPEYSVALPPPAHRQETSS